MDKANKKEAKPRISPDYKVGNLTVIKATGERRSDYTVWLCQCTCGGEIRLDTRYLQRRTITDCGCITKVKPGRRDLTGMRFGKLVCIKPLEGKFTGGQTGWLCKCDCGNECEAGTHQLLQGYKKSCGCLSHPPLKEYIGKRFGQLVVTEYAGKVSGMHRWKCICDCGNETMVGQTLLQSGKTKSCGCLQATIISKNLQLSEGTSVTILEATKQRLWSNNKSGYTGVYQDGKTEKWHAQITFKGKTYYLGSYADIEDAIAARQRGERMHDEFLAQYYAEQE